MAITTLLYNDAAARFIVGLVNISHDFKVMLLAFVTPDAAHTTLTQVKASGNEIYGTNWPLGGISLENMAIGLANTNGAALTADNISITIPGGLGPYTHIVVYDNDDAFKQPLLIISLGEETTVLDGHTVDVIWNAQGMVSFAVG